jgi:hypothetical protein
MADQERHAATGPLVVSTANPRYFAVASAAGAREQVVYLTRTRDGR